MINMTARLLFAGITAALAATTATIALTPSPAAHDMTQTQTLGQGSSQYPSGLPPYWHRDPPNWCTEDMPCWIGSKADGRSDAASYVDWQQVVRGYYDCLRPPVKSKYWISTCVRLWSPNTPQPPTD